MVRGNDKSISSVDVGTSSHSYDCGHAICIKWLDLRVLRKLSDDTSAEIVPNMVEVFIDELREQATLIETAARDSDLSLMERESHIIKSSAGMYGAPRVRSSATRLNKACKVDDASAAFSLAEALAADIPYTIAALRIHYDLPERADS